MKLYFVLGGGCLADLIVAAATNSFDHQFSLLPRTDRPILILRDINRHANDPFLMARDFDDNDETVLFVRSPAGSRGGRAGSRAGSDAGGRNTPREKSPSPKPEKQVNFNTPNPSPGHSRSVSPSMESSGTDFRGVTPGSVRSRSRPQSGSPSPGLTDGTGRRGGYSRSPGSVRGGSNAGSDFGPTRGGYRSRGTPGSSMSRGGRSRGSDADGSQTATSPRRASVLYGSRGDQYPNPFAVPVGVPYQHMEMHNGYSQFAFQGPQVPQSISAYHGGPSANTRSLTAQYPPASVQVHSGGTQGYMETRHGLSGGHMRDSTRVAPILPSAPNDPSTVLAQNPEAVHGITDATAIYADAMSGIRATGSKAVGTKITTGPGSRAAIISTAGGQRVESVKTGGSHAAGAVSMWSENNTPGASPIQHTAILRGSGRVQTSAFNVDPPESLRSGRGG